MFCTLKFDYKKATQALNFFAIKCGGKIDKMKALKLIFFADRYHTATRLSKEKAAGHWSL